MTNTITFCRDKWSRYDIIVDTESFESDICLKRCISKASLESLKIDRRSDTIRTDDFCNDNITILTQFIHLVSKLADLHFLSIDFGIESENIDEKPNTHTYDDDKEYSRKIKGCSWHLRYERLYGVLLHIEK